MPKRTETINIFADGGSRGNPGPGAAAFVLKDTRGNRLVAQSFFLGQTTNNEAEYSAVLKALTAAKQIGAKYVVVFSDSELVVKQINGQYRVKSENLKGLFQQTIALLNDFESWKVQHIKREKNTEADKLVNQAMDREENIKMDVTEPNKKSIRLGVLISGGGTTLINILDYIKAGKLNAEVAVVISSRSKAAGVEKARTASLDVKVIRKKDYPEIAEFSIRIEQELAEAKVDLVIQGGWLCLWKIPARYEDRVMNIHPALLPSFGGQGMWGHHVHEAVLKSGAKITGCTVHFCTNEYDKGPIIVQRCCEVKDDDSPQTLAARVFEQECIAYPQAIKLFADGKLIVENGRTKVKQM